MVYKERINWLHQEIAELEASALEYDNYPEYAKQAARLRNSAAELKKTIDLIEKLAVARDRYEKLRKLNTHEFYKLNCKNLLTNKPFDELVDELK
jgi:adenylate kinase family enzyme